MVHRHGCDEDRATRERSPWPRPPRLQAVFRRAVQHAGSTALRDRHAEYTYAGLWRCSRLLAEAVSEALEGRRGQRVAFLCPNDASYVMALWACWISGQIAVPLSPLHPEASLKYFVEDSGAGLLMAAPSTAARLAPLAAAPNKASSAPPLRLIGDDLRAAAAADTNARLEGEDLITGKELDIDGAMIIYTSGTTSLPKGVLLSHGNLAAQVQALLDAWRIGPEDNVLHALPLHHMHGIMNALLCPLAAGGRWASGCNWITMLPKFSASQVWSEMLSEKPGRVNVFMAVPTSYAKLVDEYHATVGSTPEGRERVKATMEAKMRLMASGSAPLPVPLFERWEQITGHRLLERFGMSEVGMVLSNPLEPQSARRPGFVGTPLPRTRVRLVRPATDAHPREEILCEGDEHGTKLRVKDGQPTVGNLLVKGPNVCSGYWNKPDATAKEFTAQGWFKTGDTCEFVDGAYKILGRTSVDIIKTGGYKVSAVQVETCLLGHPDISDCAVVGLPDDTWGQSVAAVARLREGAAELSLDQLRDWGRERLPAYALPRTLRVVQQVPRNAMGKVNKKSLVAEVFPEAQQAQ
ncbi:Malonate--CoA ligase ACSF3, mitochondrial [Frankliniella fusca]|uniref:Malonate--CoA ligase ACSF3, mitochondrial n=1 Tax=Frankliniella fusca TaxID=407009 RepID=A0AAE1HGB3_9NEOP|nr:Malonate--CoA ligase ACSF3, mitochondrial [Frankliniella fusca]